MPDGDRTARDSAFDVPRTGEMLDGRYVLGERIGTGGMGVVYLASDEVLGRSVAVKVFRDAAAEAARTSSETRVLAGLNHASLVTLFDAHVVTDELSFLVMEYVDGPTLAERIAAGPIAAADVAVMARDLAEGLHVVHEAGIVHRDIKPSNVLLRASHVPGEEFRAKLADFGIAYLIDSTRLTLPGTMVGTAAYLSPEQVRGAEPASASDIYSLGLVLIEALTGRRAFAQSGHHEAALARLSLDPEVPAEIDPGWRELLSGMTARDPAGRPSALEVVIAANALAARAAAGALGGAVGSPGDGAGARGDEVPTEVHEQPGRNDGLTATMVLPVEQRADARPADTATEVLRPPAAGHSVDDDDRARAELAAAPTTVFAHAAAPAPAATEPRTAAPASATAFGSERAGRRERRSDGHPRRRWPLVLIVLIVVAIVIGAIVWVVATQSASPQPTLPPLDEPIGTHLQELLDSVTR